MGAARGTTAKTRPRPTGSAQPYGHVFKAKLEELLIGATMAYWVVFLPAKLRRKAPFAAGKKLRMRGVVGGVHGRLVAMAWQLSGGRHYLMFGRATARSLGLALGDEVDVAFSIVVDDDVDVPEELAEALSQEPAWTKLWAALTPGKKRGFAHLVGTIKSPDLRAQRAVDLMRALEEGGAESVLGRARAGRAPR